MSGPLHFPHLIVSLMTLRRFHSDPVTVYAYRISKSIAEVIAEDDRLNIKVQLWNPETLGDKSHLLEKLKVVQSVSEPALYLDADTMILGRLDGLTQNTEAGIVATQCNDDVTMTRKMKSRIRRLRKTPEIPAEYVQKALTEDYPTLNGGVFVSRPSRALDTWLEWTTAAYPIQSVPDETILNVLQTKENVKVVDGYNVSPNCRRPAKIVHGYSFRWWRTNDPIWFACLKEVETSNYGNFQKWKRLSDLFLEYHRKQREASMIMRQIRQERRKIK